MALVRTSGRGHLRDKQAAALSISIGEKYKKILF